MAKSEPSQDEGSKKGDHAPCGIDHVRLGEALFNEINENKNVHESRVFLNSAMLHMCETLIFNHGFLDYYYLQPKVVSNVWEKIKYTMVNYPFRKNAFHKGIPGIQSTGPQTTSLPLAEKTDSFQI